MKILIALLGLILALPAWSEDGVTRSQIVIGGVMDLEGQSRGLGQGMRTGILAAIDGRSVGGRQLVFRAENDSYTPSLTERKTQQLVNDGVFVMLGNVGTPTAAVALPILDEAEVPAIGFFTGAGLLRPGQGDVINFRASYVQEVAAVIDRALRAGVRVDEICAYVQNDSYGMAGVMGVKEALSSRPRTREIVRRLDQILEMEGENPERNNIGPVGVYQRNTLTSREGYQSLKKWEQEQSTECRLVVTTGAYAAVGRFVAYARYKQENWIISAVSFTGADSLREVLEEFGVEDRVIMTQVVPSLDSNIKLVQEAKTALGEQFDYVTLEGYIVGSMLVKALASVKGEMTRSNLMDAFKGAKIDLSGLELDFTNDNQGSDLVTMTYYQNKEYKPMTVDQWIKLF